MTKNGRVFYDFITKIVKNIRENGRALPNNGSFSPRRHNSRLG
jgi:hypothetical protein